MNASSRALLIGLLILPLMAMAAGTHYVSGDTMYVAKSGTEAVYLNAVIAGDTVSGGARADSNRVYVLERGGYYFWNTVVQNAGWTLDIEGGSGSDPLPEIIGLKEPDGTTVPYELVDVAGDVIVKNTAWSGVLDTDTSYMNAYEQTFIMFRCAVAGYKMEFTGNVLANTGQAIASAFGACTKIKFIDNIIANTCDPVREGTGNGRVVDIRNTSIDTLEFTNNTIIFGFDRVVRHKASVGHIAHFIFDHNTVYENGGRYGFLAIGAVAGTVQITNNLLVDPMAVGCDTLTDRQWDFPECDEFDDNGKVRMAWIYNQKVDTLEGATSSTWDIKNNYWHITDEIQSVYDTCHTTGWDPVVTSGPQLSLYIASLVDTTTAFINLSSIAFANAPEPFKEAVLWQIKPVSAGGTGGGSTGSNFPGWDRRTIDYYRDTADFSYSTSSLAYAGGTDGFPVGDLNWFPDKKALYTGPTGVAENAKSTIADKYSLAQNYPNPFNPSTQIEFAIPKQAQVSLKVFNLLGQEVATLVNGMLNAGQHSATFNASRLASGVYFYTLKAGDYTSTRKMVLMK